LGAFAAVAVVLTAGVATYEAISPSTLGVYLFSLPNRLGMGAVPEVTAATKHGDDASSGRNLQLAKRTSPVEFGPSRRSDEVTAAIANSTAVLPEAMRTTPDGMAIHEARVAPSSEAALDRLPAQTPSASGLAVDPVRSPSGMLPVAVGNAKSFRDCQNCPEMIRVPRGSFRMGSREDASEQPIHQVTVPPFALSRFPITNQEWRHCIEAKACRFTPDGADASPVRNVSWADAQEYIDWLTSSTGQPYRLPSESEWEYAARAGTITRYWWGDRLVLKMANCRGCGEPYDSRKPLEVGSTAPNPFGLHDMGGAIAQWVGDCWHSSYQGAPADGSAWVEPGCRERVLRGGSWRNTRDEVRPASRAHYEAGVRHPSHGFRVARTN
jgi:formylglycine-generating enzyme required for sulfatase activity